MVANICINSLRNKKVFRMVSKVLNIIGIEQSVIHNYSRLQIREQRRIS